MYVCMYVKSQNYGDVSARAQQTEVIWLGTRQQLAKLSQADMTLQLPDDTLIAQSLVRNLCVQLDTTLNFDAQARNCVKTC